LGPIHVDL